MRILVIDDEPLVVDVIAEALRLTLGKAQMFGLQVFGLLRAGGAVGQGIGVDGPGAMETVVATLSGVVELSNRPPGIGRPERVRASETSGVRGSQEPVRLHLRVEDLKTVTTRPRAPANPRRP